MKFKDSHIDKIKVAILEMLLYRRVGPVETNVFPDRIDFYRICPSDRHVWESLLLELLILYACV
jgi:hypothetical protein